MARGWWTRWGRGDCVGYGLVIGEGPFSFRADIVRSIRTSAKPVRTWRASINGVAIADGLPHKEAAMAKVVEEVERAMAAVVSDWDVIRRNSRTDAYSSPPCCEMGIATFREASE